MVILHLRKHKIDVRFMLPCRFADLKTLITFLINAVLFWTSLLKENADFENGGLDTTHMQRKIYIYCRKKANNMMFIRHTKKNVTESLLTGLTKSLHTGLT